MEAEANQAQQQQVQASLINQAGQLAKSPIGEQVVNGIQQQQGGIPGQEIPQENQEI